MATPQAPNTPTRPGPAQPAPTTKSSRVGTPNVFALVSGANIRYRQDLIFDGRLRSAVEKILALDAEYGRLEKVKADAQEELKRTRPAAKDLFNERDASLKRIGDDFDAAAERHRVALQTINAHLADALKTKNKGLFTAANEELVEANNAFTARMQQRSDDERAVNLKLENNPDYMAFRQAEKAVIESDRALQVNQSLRMKAPFISRNSHDGVAIALKRARIHAVDSMEAAASICWDANTARVLDNRMRDVVEDAGLARTMALQVLDIETGLEQFVPTDNDPDKLALAGLLSSVDAVPRGLPPIRVERPKKRVAPKAEEGRGRRAVKAGHRDDAVAALQHSWQCYDKALTSNEDRNLYLAAAKEFAEEFAMLASRKQWIAATKGPGKWAFIGNNKAAETFTRLRALHANVLATFDDPGQAQEFATKARIAPWSDTDTVLTDKISQLDKGNVRNTPINAVPGGVVSLGFTGSFVRSAAVGTAAWWHSSRVVGPVLRTTGVAVGGASRAVWQWAANGNGAARGRTTGPASARPATPVAAPAKAHEEPVVQRAPSPELPSPAMAQVTLEGFQARIGEAMPSKAGASPKVTGQAVVAAIIGPEPQPDDATALGKYVLATQALAEMARGESVSNSDRRAFMQARSAYLKAPDPQPLPEGLPDALRDSVVRVDQMIDGSQGRSAA